MVVFKLTDEAGQQLLRKIQYTTTINTPVTIIIEPLTLLVLVESQQQDTDINTFSVAYMNRIRCQTL